MVEKLRGLTILGKIDLNNEDEKLKKISLEKYLPELKIGLTALATRLSSEYGDFFNDRGQIINDDIKTDHDCQLIIKKEMAFAAAKNKNIDQWRLDREKNPANLTEICLTLLFDKILKQDFVIVRVSDFDDYIHGADMLIIDKNTGAVICGIDDVLGHLGDDGGRKKKITIESIMKSGGAEIKYGATIKDHQLIRQSLSNIPLFYFSISKIELSDLLESLTNNQPALSISEKEVFSKLVNSLNQQAEEFAQNKELDGNLKLNLAKLQPSLEKMLSYC